MNISEIKIEGLKGVGTVELNLVPNQRVYAFIGTNGIGKTKILEAWFQALFYSSTRNSSSVIWGRSLVAEKLNTKIADINHQFSPPQGYEKLHKNSGESSKFAQRIEDLDQAIVFLASQNRGHIQNTANAVPAIGTFEDRKKAYIEKICYSMRDDFAGLGMNVDIERWFIVRAQSANPFQKQKDNRKVEIDTLLRLLSKIDERIDPTFMEIAGDNRVSIKLDGEERELSQLSTGFASIVKMLQAIIAGYANLTNEVNLTHVRGIVLIDEIESHLHIGWQTKIIPLLKEMFPNTTFFVATHSSLVLSQLQEGEAYRLKRDGDGVVRSALIQRPNKATLADLLDDAFDVDVNALKIENAHPDDQSAFKARLDKALEQALSKVEQAKS